MKKRLFSALLCLAMMLALTAQFVPAANAEVLDHMTMTSPIVLEVGNSYPPQLMLRYEGIDSNYRASVEASVPGISVYAVIENSAASYYFEGTFTQPGTYPVVLLLRDPNGNVVMEKRYEFVIEGEVPVDSVYLELIDYRAGANISNAWLQIHTAGVEFASQGTVYGYVFQATDSRTAEALTSGTFQENADYYVMVFLDIKDGYKRNYDTDQITLTVNGQTATKAKGGMNNIAGNDGDSKLLVRFKLPRPAHTHTPDGGWKSDGTNHWRICAGCGQQIDFATHFGGEKTCQYKAQCEVCETFYGSFADHDWSKTWDYATADGHYHYCNTPGCSAISPVTRHNPGPEATEEEDQTCKDCGYVITPAKGHIHKEHVMRIPEIAPTCHKDGRIQFYHCSCGGFFRDANATQEITEKDLVVPKRHSFGDQWQTNETVHWQVCEACKVESAKEAHADGDKNGKCDVCHWEMAAEETETTEVTDPAEETKTTTQSKGDKTETKDDSNGKKKPTKDKNEQTDKTDKQDPAGDDSGAPALVIVVCVLAVLVLVIGAALVILLIKLKKK